MESKKYKQQEYTTTNKAIKDKQSNNDHIAWPQLRIEVSDQSK